MTDIIPFAEKRRRTVAPMLRRLADRIESGEIEDVAHMIVVIQTGHDVFTQPMGEAKPSERIGILQYAIQWIYENRK